MKITIPKYPDLFVLKGFMNVLKFMEKNEEIDLDGEGEVTAITTWEQAIQQEDFSTDLWVDLGITSGTYHFKEVILRLYGYTYKLTRGGVMDRHYDSIERTAQDSRSAPHNDWRNKFNKHLHRISAEFAKQFLPPNSNEDTIKAFTEDQVQLSSHVALVERLEQANVRVLEEAQRDQQKREDWLNGRLLKLEEEIANKNQRLDEKYQQKNQSLEEEFKNRQLLLEKGLEEREANSEKTTQQALLEIQQQQKALAEREAQIDDSSNTFARRQIRKDILKEIKERTQGFSVSKGTKKLRLPIFIGMLALTAFFAGMTIYTVWEIQIAGGTNENTPIVMIIKQILYSVGFVGSMLYFIRWMNRWLRQHADAEFQIRQFQLDIERASWVVETSLEWQKESAEKIGKDMPEYLVRELTQNLFGDGGIKDQVAHPADQLASALLGSASKIKLKAGENEIQINPRKLKRQKGIDIEE